MTKILSTKDYSIFKKHENNRDISSANLKKLVFSIKTQNMLQFRPILVDSSMYVIDGQHRLEAAKELGLEVYYQINEQASHEDIVILNNNQKPWEIDDYVKYYISRGNQDYRKLQELSVLRSMTINELMKFYGQGARTTANDLKAGMLKYFTPEQEQNIFNVWNNLNKVIELLQRYLINNTKVLNSKKLRQGLMNFLNNPQVDMEVFMQKLSYKSESVRPCVDSYSYYCMFRDIYNWKNQNPIE